MANGISGTSLQFSYPPVQVPLIMGVATQSPGNMAYNQYLVSFSITNIPPVVVSYPIDFTVIAGVANQYPIDFNVISRVSGTLCPISFSVFNMVEYPIDFTVVTTARHLYGINFSVTGPRYSSGTVSFTVKEGPPITFYPVDFSVVESVTKKVMVSFYVNSGTANMGIPVSVVSTPVGGGVTGRYSLTFKVYQNNQYIGGNDASIRLTTGQGVNVDFLGIPQVYTGTQVIETYNRGSLIHTTSGSYQEYLGVTVL